jgi:hypothetical protein
MTVKSRIFGFFVVGVLTGCGSWNVKSDRFNNNNPQVRDEPYAARSKGGGDVRRRVLVLPFLDGAKRKSQVNVQSARKALVQSLFKTDQVVLVQPTDFPRDLNRMRNEHEYDLEAISKVAAGVGIAVVVEGKVLEIKARRISDPVGLMRSVRAQVEGSVRIRAYASKTGKEILNDVRTAEMETSTTRVAKTVDEDRNLDEDPKLVEDVITKAVQATVPEIIKAVNKISWEGRIALVRGEKIYLNAGRISGLQVGDIIKVSEEGEDIFDPDTGALIGRVPGHMKGTLEIISYVGQDGTACIVHSGGGFKENDRVELY